MRAFAARARALWVTLALTGLCVCAVPSAFAQMPEAPRGSGNLFGGVDLQPGGPRSLNTTVSISRAYDDDLTGQGFASTAPSRIGGGYSNLDLGLSLREAGRRTAASADVATSLRHYSDSSGLVDSNHWLDADLVTKLGARTSVRAHLDARHVSALAFEAFTDQRYVEADSHALLELQNASTNWTTSRYGGTAEVTRTLGRRSSFTLSYGTWYSGPSIVQGRNTEQAVAASFKRRVGRNTSVGLSYTARRRAQRLMDGSSRVQRHDAQFGVERQWQHSALRRTVVMLAVGPSLLDDQLSVLQIAGTGRLVSASGSIFVSHDLSHNWTAAVSYRRGAGFSGYRPSLNHAAIDIRGSAGRRVDLTLAGGYSDGEYGLSAFDKRNKTYFGTARLRMALTERIAVYAESSLYQYDFSGLTSRPSGYPSHVDRRALRAGVTLWLPLLE